MKPISWNSGVRWGDPNLRWGNPSYMLEEGDPGYVAPPPGASQSSEKRKRSSMQKQDYVKRTREGFSLQLNEFHPALVPRKDTMRITDAIIADAKARAEAVAESLANLHALQKAAQQHAKYHEVLVGGGTFPAGDQAPTPPVLTYAKQIVPPGAELWFRETAQSIKTAPDYKEYEGEALGIEGPVLSPKPANEVQPVFKAVVAGGRVFLDWSWNGYKGVADSIIFWVDRGDGKGRVMLTIDTTVGYEDTEDWPVGGPKRWTYTAQFRKGDQLIGLESAAVSVVVG